ncbi:histidine phosphatase family protein [Tomitella biformata]|uniref:histidine phosphatase family protein n=1 Tax=Tomitella biformata TaxID=630403 RepID=UPI000465DEF2|nr:histidine phosphatase family protein [Tomitella biformata]
MTGRLILVRHGQTVANVAHQLDTLPPGAPLTEEGERQAEVLGLGLADRSLAALVSSTALRARQTANPVSRTTDSGIEIVDGLYEIQAGDLEGRSDEEAHRQFVEVYTQWHRGNLAERLPGGESGHDALGRYLPQLDELRAGYLQEGTDQDVVVVSHGAIIRLAVAAMSGIDRAFADSRYLANTEAVTLAPTADGGWECVQWGEDRPPFTVRVDANADDPSRAN